ncbi:MAG: membrane protein insertion efficiency factor YidD [candidate division Zixibacteria bacterium]|nr:membrane protein insertion efficiency factor YidD [candidate division Zixibacteria bacterium]
MTPIAISLKTTSQRIGVWLAVAMVRTYQMLLAPLFVGGGCRHLPSCSSYAIEAFERHGLMRGGRLAATRLWRCRPGGTMGYDPVPESEKRVDRCDSAAPSTGGRTHRCVPAIRRGRPVCLHHASVDRTMNRNSRGSLKMSAPLTSQEEVTRQTHG